MSTIQEAYWNALLADATYALEADQDNVSGQRLIQIGYSTFDQNRTLLAAPSGNACHSWAGIWSKENQTKYFVK